ncbi:MAG: N-acetyltransferase [Alphaproteobacteria bacterium]|nr:N-acetyltransferase [Alphaproteobacteria bacterium]
MDVRDEGDADHGAVRAVVRAAFGQPAETDLVDALRRDGDAVIALVAVCDGAIVGHIMLSRMTAPVRALGLAPVAVLPDQQGQGIGSRLIRESLNRAAAQGWAAVFVVGEPGYYARFGFRADLADRFASPYAGPHFMALELVDGALEGKSGAVAFSPAFAAL